MSRPRFIAGAVCPKCSAMDRLQVFEANGEQKRRCVACGHEDDLSATASQPPTNRLDGGLKKPDPRASSPVRILDPGTNGPSGKP
jgi:uncharacterized metal-binding protein (TIGR02443 family)